MASKVTVWVRSSGENQATDHASPVCTGSRIIGIWPSTRPSFASGPSSYTKRPVSSCHCTEKPGWTMLKKRVRARSRLGSKAGRSTAGGAKDEKGALAIPLVTR